MSNSKSVRRVPATVIVGPSTVVIGENLVDLLVDETGDVRAVLGGGPFNVARTIARLGQTATLFSRLSSDAFGDVIRKVLERDGVNLGFEAPVDLPTALAVVDVSFPSPRYSFHLRDTAAFEITSREGVSTFLSTPYVAALCIGTLGLVVEPMATMVEDVVAAVPPSLLVALDPNCRPSATPDHHAYRSRINRLMSRSDIVKVSTEDLEFLLPHITKSEAAAKLLGAGAAIVIVTDGPYAVHVYSADREVTVDVPSCQIEDTVGAGDALVGGLLAWCAARRISRKDARRLSVISEGLSVAVKVASLTCSKKGAEPPWYSEIRANGDRWFE